MHRTPLQVYLDADLAELGADWRRARWGAQSEIASNCFVQKLKVKRSLAMHPRCHRHRQRRRQCYRPTRTCQSCCSDNYRPNKQESRIKIRDLHKNERAEHASRETKTPQNANAFSVSMSIYLRVMLPECIAASLISFRCIHAPIINAFSTWNLCRMC